MDKPRHMQSSARVRQVHKEPTGAAVKDKAQEELETQGREEDDVGLKPPASLSHRGLGF